MSDWQPIETVPRDGRKVLLYRPLAHRTSDEAFAVKRTTPAPSFCWQKTIPDGTDGLNFTDGLCYATHWMPIPEPPASPTLDDPLP